MLTKPERLVPIVSTPETQEAVADPHNHLSTRTDGSRASSTSVDSVNAQATAQSAMELPDISAESLRPMFRKLSLGLDNEATSFGSLISHTTFPEPTGLPTERSSGAIITPVPICQCIPPRPLPHFLRQLCVDGQKGWKKIQCYTRIISGRAAFARSEKRDPCLACHGGSAGEYCPLVEAAGFR